MRRRGPKVKLAEIASSVGLSAARLVQRFGSRDRLLAAVELRVDHKMKASIVKAMSRSASPIDGLIDGLAEISERNARRLYQLAHSYIYDPGDLAPAARTREAKARETIFTDEFRRALDRAMAVGELLPCDTARLARLVHRARGVPELGALLSCKRDASRIDGFNPDVELTRTQTLMQGASHCDFRYQLRRRAGAEREA